MLIEESKITEDSEKAKDVIKIEEYCGIRDNS